MRRPTQMVGSFGCAVIMLTGASIAQAEAPRLIHYQGKLVTASGAIVSGPVDLRVRLYDDPVSSAMTLFDETHSTVELNRGLFSILVGSVAPGGVPDSALTAVSVYLGVSVGGEAELAPRIRIATAPYAARTRSAQQLVRPGEVEPDVVLGTAGNVGIGTTTPDASAALDVSSSAGGLLPPRMTTSARDAISNPAPGLLVFNTDTACIDMWTGTTWKRSCFDCSFTPPVTGNNGPICEGSTLELTATSILDATYSWTGPNNFTSAEQNPDISNATPAASGPYSVTATVDGCTSNPVTTLATVNPIPASPTVGNNGPICPGSTLMLTSSAVPGAIYSWSGPGGFTSNVQNPTIPNATNAVGGNYILTISVNGCAAAPVQTTVTVNPPPPATPGAISGLGSGICPGTSGVAYSVVPVQDAVTYTWSVPPDAIITSGQGTTSILVTFGSASGTIIVNAANGCGTSADRTLAVTVACPASCLAIRSSNPSATDGTYTVDPDGPGGASPFAVYCDMTTDDGGWTLVVRIFDAHSHNNCGAVGTLTSPTQTSAAKLSDTQINALSTELYRFRCETTTAYFDANSRPFDGCNGGQEIIRFKRSYAETSWQTANSHSNHRGVTDYPISPQHLIYAADNSSWTGCYYVPDSSGGTGVLWAR